MQYRRLAALASALALALLAPGFAHAQLPPSYGLVINNTPIQGGSSGQCLFISSGKLGSQACGSGSGTVTSVSVTTANGVSGTVANPTSTPAISLSLGAITPTSVAIGAGTAITSSGPGGALASGAYAVAAPCSAFGTASGQCAQGGTITAGGPTGSSTTVPVITYNAAGQLTAITSTAISSAVTSQVVGGTYSLATASGTQTLTFNFTPSSCDGFGTVNSTATLSYTTLSAHSDSSGTQTSLIYFGGGLFSEAFFFGAVDSTGSNFQSAIISYGTNSVTLTWTKVGTPTGTFAYSVRCFK